MDTFLNDLGFGGFRIRTPCWQHTTNAKKPRTGAHLNLSAHQFLALRGWVDEPGGRIQSPPRKALGSTGFISRYPFLNTLQGRTFRTNSTQSF